MVRFNDGTPRLIQNTLTHSTLRLTHGKESKRLSSQRKRSIPSVPLFRSLLSLASSGMSEFRGGHCRTLAGNLVAVVVGVVGSSELANMVVVVFRQSRHRQNPPVEHSCAKIRQTHWTDSSSCCRLHCR